jgi:preprotein translocase subunit SecG
MAFFIGLLTVVMVLDCVVLIFLVLIQLPKKEAGAGLAFGAGATDALFGAGSGTVLTKITKYAATIFFALAVILSVLQSRFHRRYTSEFERDLEKSARPVSGAVSPGPAAPAQPATTTNNNNNNLLLSTPGEATNLPAASSSNPAPTTSPTVPK